MKRLSARFAELVHTVGDLSGRPHGWKTALASACGLSPTHFYAVLGGRRGLSLDASRQVAERLSVRPEYFVAEPPVSLEDFVVPKHDGLGSPLELRELEALAREARTYMASRYQPGESVPLDWLDALPERLAKVELIAALDDVRACDEPAGKRRLADRLAYLLSMLVEPSHPRSTPRVSLRDWAASLIEVTGSIDSGVYGSKGRGLSVRNDGATYQT